MEDIKRQMETGGNWKLLFHWLQAPVCVWSLLQINVGSKMVDGDGAADTKVLLRWSIG